MCTTCDTLGDNTEAVVLHCGGAADATKKALLDTLPEFDYRNAVGGLEEIVRWDYHHAIESLCLQW